MQVKKEDLPKELYDFINSDMLPYGASYYDQSNERELTNEELSILVEKGDASPDVLWKQNGEGWVSLRVRYSVDSQLPSSYEDFSYSYTYNNPCWDMIIPFWVIYYSYKGVKYVFVTDGMVKVTKVKSPIDERQASESDAIQKDLTQKSRKSNWSIFYFFLFVFLTIITLLLFFRRQRNVFLYLLDDYIFDLYHYKWK